LPAIEQRDTPEPVAAATANRRPRNPENGLSLLEFTLIVIIVGVLLVVGMQRMVELRVQIERAAVERTVRAMEAGLALEFADLAVNGELERARDWAGANALELLSGRDVFDYEQDANPAGIGPGEWSYDEATGEVVYRVRYVEALTSDDPLGRWRVVIIGGDGTGPRGLTLEQTRAIDWP